MTGKYIGLEDVTVPAGSFNDCAVFEFTVVSESSETSGDEKYSFKNTEVHTNYFASGIGLVKEGWVQTEEFNGEKNEYWETRVLTSYYIP